MNVALSLLLAIPLAIIANLLTPRVMAALDERSSRRAESRNTAESEFRNQVDRLAAHAEELNGFLLRALVRIAYFGALLGAVAGGIALVAQSISPVQRLASGGYGDDYIEFGRWSLDVYATRDVLFMTAQAVGLVATLITLNLARDAYRVYQAVRQRSSGSPLGTEPTATT